MRVTVNQQQQKTIKVNSQGTSEVVSIGIQGPPGPSSITQAGDVDSTNLTDGSVLVYTSATSKWRATTTLEQQNLEGGEF
jgi:hypothetical protein